MTHPLTFLTHAVQTGPIYAGAPQSAGPMTVVPLFGPAGSGYASPRSGLKLSAVRGYGNMELECREGGGLAIVPLHIGYIQKGAQNHAMCRSAFIDEGQKVLFEDACCVQESQGGYLEERDQWFFVLPLSLREEALSLRGEKNYGKLWDAIRTFNARFGIQKRGHLEGVIGNRRSVLTQQISRFERLPGQLGAMFFFRDQPVGVEICPNPDYFAEVFDALVCFAYGAEAHLIEQADLPQPALPPLSGDDIFALRASLIKRRCARRARLEEAVSSLPPQHFELTDEERFPGHRLRTVLGVDFAGQLIQRIDGSLAYLSLFARAARLARIRAA